MSFCKNVVTFRLIGLPLLVSETENGTDNKIKSLQTNVIGEHRAEPVRIPKYIYSSKPGVVPNNRVYFNYYHTLHLNSILLFYYIKFYVMFYKSGYLWYHVIIQECCTFAFDTLVLSGVNRMIVLISANDLSLQFAYIEEPVRRKVNTSSVASAQIKMSRNMQNLRGFELLPDKLDFGTLKEGNTYAFTVYLKNIGVDACRFKITQPPPSTGLKVMFRPGPVSSNAGHFSTLINLTHWFQSRVATLNFSLSTLKPFAGTPYVAKMCCEKMKNIV